MKQRRTMRIGQTIVLSLFLVLIGISMFLPVFRINGVAFNSALNKAVDYAFDHVDQSSLEEILDKEEIQEAKKEAKEEAAEESEEFEEKIKEYEKENGVKIRQISAFRIMTNSYGKLLYGKNWTAEVKNNIKENEFLSKIDSKYNTLRVILWIIYMLAFVILFMVILGAMLRWSKFITAAITIAYGLAATAVFFYLRFGMVGSIIKAIDNNTDLLDSLGIDGLMAISVNMTSLLKEVLSSFYSIGFFADFILVLLVVVISLISMLTGNKREMLEDSWDGMPTDDFNPFGSAGSIPASNTDPVFGQTSAADPFNMSAAAGMSSSSHDMDLTATPTAPLVSMATPTPPPVAPAAPISVASAPVGQVKCTMGSAVGQGFRLPADRKVVIGKSPQNANMVINHPNVSNIHCSIRYNASNNSYIVKDHSMNGTFVNGVRLQKDVPMAYPAGTVLSLADGSNQITLG